MSWEQVTNIISQFMDKPIVITITGVLSSALVLFTLFAKSSFGKKAIIKLTSLYNLGQRTTNETLKKVQDVETLAKEKISALEAEYSQKADEIQRACEEKVALALSFVVFYEESVLSVLDKLPNAKVKAALLEFKSKLDEKKKTITATIGELYFDFTKAVENKEKEIQEQYNEKILFLEDEIKKLTLYIEEIKGEQNNGEQREEPSEINSDSTEEEIQND